jgi:hypothetical protein
MFYSLYTMHKGGKRVGQVKTERCLLLESAAECERERVRKDDVAQAARGDEQAVEMTRERERKRQMMMMKMMMKMKRW